MQNLASLKRDYINSSTYPISAIHSVYTSMHFPLSERITALHVTHNKVFYLSAFIILESHKSPQPPNPSTCDRFSLSNMKAVKECMCTAVVLKLTPEGTDSECFKKITEYKLQLQFS